MSFGKALLYCVFGMGLILIVGFSLGALPLVINPIIRGLMVVADLVLFVLALNLIIGTVAKQDEEIRRLKYK
jgi:hypothetical protein